MDSNWVAPAGPELDEFERLIRQKVKQPYSLALSSGTAAIHLGLKLLGVGSGDLVITQSHTFVASANTIRYLGAEPVFIDSESQSWNLDPLILEEAIEDLKRKNLLPKVKAIMPVHIYGMPGKLDEIMRIAKHYEIPVIEDAAEALGSNYQNKALGTFGKLGIYSFNGNKIITTSGGGMLVSVDQALIEEARFLATQAREDFPHYEHQKLGYNYRLSNILAALGVAQMAVLDKRIEQRRANFARYQTYFRDKEDLGYLISFQKEPTGGYSNRWLTTILIDPDKNKGITRDHIFKALAEANIESRPAYKPMHLQPLYKDSLYYGNGISDRIFEQGLCLPSGSSLSIADWDRIYMALDKVFT